MLVSTLSTLREIRFDFDHDIFSTHDKKIIKAIRQTLAYFNILEIPLTAWEVYIHLWRVDIQDEISFLKVKKILAQGCEGVSMSEGYYFLSGHENILQIRKNRYVIAEKKYRRVRYISQILSLFPYIDMIAVSNSLAYDNATEQSDIDFFIITSADKIWTARFFVNTLLKIFGLRPNSTTKQDKICLNIFTAKDNLDLQHLMIAQDIYFIYWLRQLPVVYDRNNIYEQFMTKNRWLHNFVNTNYVYKLSHNRVVSFGKFKHFLKYLGEALTKREFTEKILKKFQIRIMPMSLKRQANKRIKENIEVIIDDKMLKFHHGSKKEVFRDTWKSKLLSLNI